MSNLSEYFCKCQRRAALQHPAAGRCGGLDKWMPRNWHSDCELKESWKMPPMGRNMLADHHWRRGMPPGQLMPRRNIAISTCARLRKEIQYCHFLFKPCLKYLFESRQMRQIYSLINENVIFVWNTCTQISNRKHSRNLCDPESCFVNWATPPTA